MHDKLNQKSVLVLDSTWRVTNVTSPKQALIDMAKNAMTALLIQGDNIFEPVKWDKWVELVVEDGKEFVATARAKIRLPTVVIAVKYTMARMVTRKPRITPHEVMRLYDGKDAYTGQHIGKRGTIDHVHPLGRGGENDWHNVVWTAPDINYKKGCRTPSEAGLPEPSRRKVLAKPLVSSIQPRADRPEWAHFLIKH